MLVGTMIDDVESASNPEYEGYQRNRDEQKSNLWFLHWMKYCLYLVKVTWTVAQAAEYVGRTRKGDRRFAAWVRRLEANWPQKRNRRKVMNRQ